MTRLFFFCVFLLAAPAPAEVFLLKNAGKIEGELLNPQETPRTSYRIRGDDGLEIAVEPKFVERTRPGEREALTEYKATAPMQEDTIANHLRIAQWCRDNQLQDLSRQHLLRVLDHDPDHVDARKLLGHFKADDGTWTTRQEFLGRSGIKKHNGSWKTQQQIDVEQILERTRKSQLGWVKQVDYLRGALPRSAQARNELLAIDDPAAAPALRGALENERNEDVRILLIRALSNIGTSAALHEIARWAVSPAERVLEVRRACFDELRKHPKALPAVIGFYTSLLRSDDPFAINGAAVALAELEGRTAIPQLIDALVTSHQRMVNVQAAGPAFDGAGNAALGWGQKMEKRAWTEQNARVLDALVRLTGVNFQYDQDAWRRWLIQSRRTPSFNARRG